MSYLQIDGTYYNVDQLVSCRFCPGEQNQMAEGSGYDKGHSHPTGNKESTTVLTLVFAGNNEVLTIEGEPANLLWSRLVKVINVNSND